MVKNRLAKFWQLLEGKKLDQVMFIHDWISLSFGLRSGLTIYSKITVVSNKHAFSMGEKGFRDQICGLIGKKVIDIDEDQTHFLVVFEDNSILKFELTISDGSTPETAIGEIEGHHVVFFNE